MSLSKIKKIWIKNIGLEEKRTTPLLIIIQKMIIIPSQY